MRIVMNIISNPTLLVWTLVWNDPDWMGEVWNLLAWNPDNDGLSLIFDIRQKTAWKWKYACISREVTEALMLISAFLPISLCTHGFSREYLTNMEGIVADQLVDIHSLSKKQCLVCLPMR